MAPNHQPVFPYGEAQYTTAKPTTPIIDGITLNQPTVDSGGRDRLLTTIRHLSRSTFVPHELYRDVDEHSSQCNGVTLLHK
jgi:hypothetical protein